jgi:hypothetical protein
MLFPVSTMHVKPNHVPTFLLDSAANLDRSCAHTFACRAFHTAKDICGGWTCDASAHASRSPEDFPFSRDCSRHLREREVRAFVESCRILANQCQSFHFKGF